MRSSLKIQSVVIAAQDLRLAGLIREYLTQTGYDAGCEVNLDAALERIMKERIDLLIVDGEMPENVLSAFVQTVAGLKPDLPIVAVGVSEREKKGKSLSAFIDAFVEKPFSIYDISFTIQELPARSSFD